ncbi:hypothetical protein G8J22_01348 [Lentilactobacillus hilgardii]|uniref:hypothetical protein n=1 Tax=Lentilactobacillus hilgardii TaxID=1588 RepID=UPI00019C6444|nr:hypothetical protein [Lentilactobacillus hilgardii]EEI18775.1 hypothetical protein HMPREF0497_2384 [Lentilactobacillus buchneri ATCC 11577]QIR09369.1 hypothetical protein G8J22_01348 [Lentilactobacillus hilgardii]
MAIFHNGKQINTLYHNGKQINTLYHNGKLIYQYFLPSGTDMFITPTVVTGSRYQYADEVIKMNPGSVRDEYDLHMFINTTIELYHPIQQAKNGIIITFKSYMAAVQTNVKPESATWGYNLNGVLTISLSQNKPTGSITGYATIDGEGGDYQLGATLVDSTHVRFWSRSETGTDLGTSVATSSYFEYFGIIDSIKIA